VTRRHQVRHHYRVPVEVAGVVEGTLVRVVDLTPGGAGLVGPHPIEVGAEVGLRMDLPTVGGEVREVRVLFTICSSRPAPGAGCRMGGTLTPVTEADGEALIEHCHVVSSRARLTETGRLVPTTVIDAGPPPEAAEPAERRAAGHV
jgi:hypothetical protein